MIASAQRRVGVTALAVTALLLGCTPAWASSRPAGLGSALGGATAPVGQLRLVSTVALPGGTRVYRYAQVVGGVPVLDRQAVAVDPRGAAPALVTDSTEADVHLPPPPLVSGSAAVGLALAAVRHGSLRSRPSAEQVLLPDDGGNPAWRVQIASRRPLATYEVLVDAQSGAIHSVRDLTWMARGKARLFDPNPVAENGGIAGLSDHHDRNSKRLTALRRVSVLDHLHSHRGCLKGDFVYVTDDSHQVCKRNRRWTSVKRSDDRFEALMAYFHIDRTQTYVTSLGVGNVNHRRQRVRTDAISQDNSAFDSGSGAILYGSGGVDDAEDADVIIHEYGHALENAQVPRFGSSLSAVSLGEGWADYLAAVMSSRSPGTTAESNACLFEWDGFGRCVRRADTGLTYPTAQALCNQDPHCIGEVWSGALWKLRGELGGDGSGRSIMDAVVVSSQFMLTPGATFQQARAALLAADGALYAGAHQAAIQDELNTNRLLPP